MRLRILLAQQGIESSASKTCAGQRLRSTLCRRRCDARAGLRQDPSAAMIMTEVHAKAQETM